MFIAPENVISLHSPKDCAVSELRWYFLRKYQRNSAQLQASYFNTLASPTFLVILRRSQYSSTATANLREVPIRSRISASVI